MTKPAIAAPRPRPRFCAARPSANEATRCSGVISVMSNVWFAVRVTPTPAPPMTAQATEQGSRGWCCDCAGSKDRAKHQTGGGRREAAELVQVDDLEREDQPVA